MKTVEELNAQVEDLTKKLEAANAELVKQKGIVENAEKKFLEHTAEVGEARKKLKAYEEQVASLRKENEELKAKISGSTTQGKKVEEREEPTAEEIEKSLDDSQRKAVEAAFANLSDDEKIAFFEDQQFRLDILKHAKKVVRSIPDSPWSKPAAKKPNYKEADEERAKRIAKLFEGVVKQQRFMPPGGSGAARREGALEEKNQSVKPRVVSGGSDFLGQLQRLRETAA